MIPVPSGVRVWLAMGHTDMRRYAAMVVMRSGRSGLAVGANLGVGVLRITATDVREGAR